MDNNKYVLESFRDYLKYKDFSINEKETSGTPLDLAGAEELVKLIMKDNGLLAEKLYEDSEGLKGQYLREAAKSIKDEKYALGGLYSMVGNIMTRLINESDFKVLKALVPDIKDGDLDSLRDTKKRKAKANDLLKELAKVSEDDARKRAKEGVKLMEPNSTYIASGIKTPFIWGGLLSPEEQGKTYAGFLAEAQKKGYNTTEGLKKVIADEFKDQAKDKRSKMEAPGLSAYLDKTESTVVTQGAPVAKSFRTAIVKEEKEDEVFKPNMYGANGEADYMEGTYKEMLDNLGAIFQRMLTGEISTIKSITVHTSADRYRNTGSAEKLSWGQLSFLRSQSMASLVVAMAQKSGLDPAVVAKVNSMIMLNFKGGNGDGTTGPNPPAPLKFGYYVEEGGKAIWKDGKDRELSQIVEVDAEGTPKGEPKDVKSKSEADKDAYNKFRYNNIEIEYEALEGQPTEGGGPIIEKVVDLKYPIKIKIPARYRKKKIKIPVPTLTFGPSISKGGGGGGKSKGATKCPDFGNTPGGVKIRSGFGFGIKTITIAQWESDLTQ